MLISQLLIFQGKTAMIQNQMVVFSYEASRLIDSRLNAKYPKIGPG